MGLTRTGKGAKFNPARVRKILESLKKDHTSDVLISGREWTISYRVMWDQAFEFLDYIDAGTALKSEFSLCVIRHCQHMATHEDKPARQAGILLALPVLENLLTGGFHEMIENFCLDRYRIGCDVSYRNPDPCTVYLRYPGILERYYLKYPSFNTIKADFDFITDGIEILRFDVSHVKGGIRFSISLFHPAPEDIAEGDFIRHTSRLISSEVLS